MYKEQIKFYKSEHYKKPDKTLLFLLQLDVMKGLRNQKGEAFLIDEAVDKMQKVLRRSRGFVPKFSSKNTLLFLQATGR
ncbi:MAG: hypothetical protein H7A25_25860 [Leptospiraceae bacterium]|nr:hypothetical protein [Leptospiraceae bacterium]